MLFAMNLFFLLGPIAVCSADDVEVIESDDGPTGGGNAGGSSSQARFFGDPGLGSGLLGFGLGVGGSLLAQNLMGGPCRFKRDNPERVEKRFFNVGGPRPCPYPPQYPPGFGSQYPPGFGGNFPPGPVPFGGGYPSLYPGPPQLSPINPLNGFGPLGPMGPYPGGFLPVPGYGMRSLDNAKPSGPVNKRLDSTETENPTPNTSPD